MAHPLRHGMKFCPRVKSLVAYGENHHTHRIYPIRCKCWTCSFCYRKNLGGLIKQIEAQPPDRFITLTCNAGYMETPLQVYLRHRPYIRKLFEKARRQFGPQEYAVFCELHKSGLPHWHILQRGAFIPYRWLSATWHAMTGSKIVDIRRCGEARGAAKYVVKYVTKSSAHARIDPRFRIVTFSKKFRGPKPARRLPLYWHFEYDRRHPEEILERYAPNHDITWNGEYFTCQPKWNGYRINEDGSIVINSHTSMLALAETLDSG